MGISEKLAYLYETKKQIKSALNTPYNVFRDYPTLISKYVKNQPKSIVEGSTAICENAIDLPCNVTVKGNTKQETTEGYNKFDISNISAVNFGSSEDEIFTTNSITTTGYGNLLRLDSNDVFDVEVGKTCYISFDAKLKSGSIEKFNSVQLMNANKVITSSNFKVINNPVPNSNYQRYIYSVDVSTEGSQLLFIQSYNTSECILNIKNVMISPVDKPYEPYTNGVATPNPNHKQDIEVITEASLVHRGKNILDCSKLSSSANTTTFENDILTITTNNSWGGSNNYDVLDTFKKNTGKKILFLYKSFDFSKGNKACVQVVYNVDGKNRYHQLVENNGKVVPFAIPENVENITSAYIKIYTNNSDTTGTTYSVTIEEPMLVLENENTNGLYEPYIEPKTIPINLNGNTLAKVGEIADLLNIGLDGSVSIKNLIKHRILNGSENWNMANNNSVNTNRFVLDDRVEGLNSGVIQAISNKLIGKTANDLWLNDIEGIGHSVSQLIMRLNTSTGVTNASTLKTWLSENNIECYSVGSEETINLPSIEPITLFEGTNIFELVTNLDTTMSVEYIVNAETLQNEITELSNAVIELGGSL